VPALTYYQTLKVPRTATHDEIRRAYHAEARRWHPDRFATGIAPEREAAEDAMRRLNEAWRVLGDPGRRAHYDTELDLAVRGPQPPHSAGVRVDSGVARIDPRLLDPEFLHSQRLHHFDTIDRRQSIALRYGPWLALVALVMGIFVFTAYEGADPSQPVPTTYVGPSLGVAPNACVRIIGGPQLIAIPCDGIYDGRIIGAHEAGGSCPAATIREVELSNGLTACLGP
jgi:hypothetical protein